jgi:DNA-binding HxlR family transcriptional regulator
MSEPAPLPEENCLAAWCAGDDWCAITCTMEVLGKKWHPAIVHRLLDDGPLRFNELADAVGPITNKVLSNSLQDLQDLGSSIDPSLLTNRSRSSTR